MLLGVRFNSNVVSKYWKINPYDLRGYWPNLTLHTKANEV